MKWHTYGIITLVLLVRDNFVCQKSNFTTSEIMRHQGFILLNGVKKKNAHFRGLLQTKKYEIYVSMTSKEKVISILCLEWANFSRFHWQGGKVYMYIANDSKLPWILTESSKLPISCHVHSGKPLCTCPAMRSISALTQSNLSTFS